MPLIINPLNPDDLASPVFTEEHNSRELNSNAEDAPLVHLSQTAETTSAKPALCISLAPSTERSRFTSTSTPTPNTPTAAIISKFVEDCQNLHSLPGAYAWASEKEKRYYQLCLEHNANVRMTRTPVTPLIPVSSSATSGFSEDPAGEQRSQSTNCIYSLAMQSWLRSSAIVPLSPLLTPSNNPLQIRESRSGLEYHPNRHRAPATFGGRCSSFGAAVRNPLAYGTTLESLVISTSVPHNVARRDSEQRLFQTSSFAGLPSTGPTVPAGPFRPAAPAGSFARNLFDHKTALQTRILLSKSTSTSQAIAGSSQTISSYVEAPIELHSPLAGLSIDDRASHASTVQFTHTPEEAPCILAVDSQAHRFMQDIPAIDNRVYCTVPKIEKQKQKMSFYAVDAVNAVGTSSALEKSVLTDTTPIAPPTKIVRR